MNEENVGAVSRIPMSTSDSLPLVVGVDLGGTQIRASVLRGATLISRVGLLTGINPTPERIMPRIFQAVQQAIDEAGVTLDAIAGIGIGAPGPLDYRTGVIYAPPNLPGWDHVPLRDIFRKQFQIPIFVENDANVAALAEYMFGAGQGSCEMVYLTISTGIGGGVITGGKILEGVTGTAGELGHMTIDRHGVRCNCGNIGCLESIASGTAIARMAREAIAFGKGRELLAFVREHPSQDQSADISEKPASEGEPTHVSARIVADAAQAGIPLACEIIATAAEGLGIGLVNVIHIFNPEIVILGGGLTQMGDLLLQPALRIVQERSMPFSRASARIVLAELGADVGLIGAGALIYHHR